MGLFDFFKKKNIDKPQNSETPKSELFLAICKYSEYIMKYISMQNRGSYAPISAYEKSNGEIVGFLYAAGDDNSFILSAGEVFERMEDNFEQKLQNLEINSYVILYHSQFSENGNHTIAVSDDQLKAITVAYNFKNDQKGQIGLPYRFENNQIEYKRFSNFSQEENNIILRTRLKKNKEYFEDRVVIKAPVIEIDPSLKVTKFERLDFSDTWSGIIGYESFRRPCENEPLQQIFAYALWKGKTFKNDNVKISQLEYEDIIVKGISINESPVAFLPVVKTDKIVAVENKEINEWEKLEAIVSGSGKDTFGIWYLATDYAENRNRYMTEKNLNIKLSGIVFVLDTHDEDYTAYLPSKDLPNFGCFDFFGVLLDFKQAKVLESTTKKAYILTVKLITHPEIEDFFSINMFVTLENMRFKELNNGMKICGMFQMQGQIAD